MRSVSGRSGYNRRCHGSFDLRANIRDIPDFPKPGIVFKDIMPLLADAEALRWTVEQLAEWAEPRKVDYVVGPKRAASSSARRSPTGWAAASSPPGSRASCRT